MQLSGIPAALLCACPTNAPGSWHGGAVANWLASAGASAYSLMASALLADTGSARRAFGLGSRRPSAIRRAALGPGANRRAADGTICGRGHPAMRAPIPDHAGWLPSVQARVPNQRSWRSWRGHAASRRRATRRQTTRRCRAHQLSPGRAFAQQNMPGRSGVGSPATKRQPWKSASVSGCALDGSGTGAALSGSVTRLPS